MNFVRYLTTWFSTALLLGIVVAVIYTIPKCGRVTAPGGVQDIKLISEYDNKSLDSSVPIRALKQEDIICYKLGEKEKERAHFGYVAARPGQTVEVKEGKVSGRLKPKIFVDGKEYPGIITWDWTGNIGPIVVPAGHVFVLSDRNRNDSFDYGPIPAEAYRGRVGVWMR